MDSQNNNQNMEVISQMVIFPETKPSCHFVLGIISVVLWFFGYSSILSVVLGIIGVVMASKSKKRVMMKTSGLQALYYL
ncbi:MAG: hypothetical protein V8R14_06255 [Clostridia bacterium]